MKQTIKKIKTSGIKLTENRGEFTRPSAAIIAALELSMQGINPNANKIDQFVFDQFYFTLAGNKTRGKSKNRGDGRLFKRLDSYLNKYPDLFKYDRFKDALIFTDLGRAKLFNETRKRVSFLQMKKFTQEVNFKQRKTVLTKADQTKVSTMFALHITC